MKGLSFFSLNTREAESAGWLKEVRVLRQRSGVGGLKGVRVLRQQPVRQGYRLVSVLVAMFLSVFCWAHDPQLSGIGVVMKGNSAIIAVQAHLKKFVGLEPSSQITNRLALSINGQPFKAAHPEMSVDQANGVVYWRANYAGVVKTFSVAQRLFPEDAGSRTIVSVTRDGAALQETIVDRSHPKMEFGGTSTRGARMSVWNVITQFVGLGIMHIFTGPDHILFILGLILLGGGLKPLLKTVTAFTIAHSITLTVAATGIWAPPSKFVEPLIALSIVAVAIENLRKRKDTRDWRPLIAFGFGLIHGFGFAGGLIEACLPHGAIGWALASFNIGVECAQASIVLAVTPLLAMLANAKPKISYRVVVAGSVAIAMAGGLWFIDRIRLA
jgi:hydrogenase/urease accessory protein HupE